MKRIEYECKNCIHNKTQRCHYCGYWGDSKERQPTGFKPTKTWLKELIDELEKELKEGE